MVASRRSRRWLAPAVLGIAWTFSGRDLGAQVPIREGLTTVEGVRLDYSPTGGWRVRAGTVADRRLALRATGGIAQLNAERWTATAALAVSGAFRLPSVLFRYADSPDSTALIPPAVYDSLFHGPAAPAGRPYSLRGLYAEMSAGLFDLQGTVTGWLSADSTLSYLISPCATSGGLCFQALLRLTGVFRRLLASADATLDFALFDSDGPDGIPNSGDDDGVVDIIQFVQPVIGAECGGPGFWAHKSTFANNDPFGGVFVTADTTLDGRPVRIDSYYIVSGVGGIDCKSAGEIMGIGLSAHELGHGLALPDLYDTGGSSNGIGEWGLMGSAMYTSLGSPGHLGAWSKERLGWVAVAEPGGPGRYQLGPALVGDSVFLVRPPVTNPRGEYFLLENKQPVLADTANLLTGGQTGPKRGGLVVWHVDSVAVAQRSATNSVNTGTLHGVKVVQADGLGQLQRFVTVGNRGDAGDPFPGDSNRTRFSQATTPAAVLNFDGSCAGFRLDSIAVVGMPGVVEFRLDAEFPIVVRASDTTAQVIVDGVSYRRFAECVDPTATYQIEIDSVQTTPDGRSEFAFLAWSDGGARSHGISGLMPGDSVVATVGVRHRVRAQVSGDGVVSAVTGEDVVAGALFDEQAVVSLTAAPGVGSVLDGWTGDTAASGDTLILRITRPFDLVATFAPVLTVASAAPPPAVVGAAYSHQLEAAGGLGVATFTLLGGTLPPGLALDPRGIVSGVPSAEGEFTASIEVRSGSQRVAETVRLQAVAPVLAIDDVITEILELGDGLTGDERRYLDLTGNANAQFDVGDVLAWLDRLGPAAAARARRELSVR